MLLLTSEADNLMNKKMRNENIPAILANLVCLGVGELSDTVSNP
jgi:hypothetical protein